MDLELSPDENQKLDVPIKVEVLETEDLKIIKNEPLQVCKIEEIKNEGTEFVFPIAKYECNICFEIFTDESMLEFHIDEYHQDDNEEPLTSTSNAGFKNNVKVHRCESCGKSFSSNYHLTRHTVVHSRYTPFQCQRFGCTKSYTTQQGLNSHTLAHDAERPFKCNFMHCTKAFRNSNEFSRHMLSHSDERPFKCNHNKCTASFKTRYHLNAHMVVHTNEKAFKCNQTEECTRVFKTKRNLNKHIRQNHLSRRMNSFEGKKKLNNCIKVLSELKPSECKQTECTENFECTNQDFSSELEVPLSVAL